MPESHDISSEYDSLPAIIVDHVSFITRLSWETERLRKEAISVPGILPSLYITAPITPYSLPTLSHIRPLYGFGPSGYPFIIKYPSTESTTAGRRLAMSQSLYIDERHDLKARGSGLPPSTSRDSPSDEPNVSGVPAQPYKLYKRRFAGLFGLVRLFSQTP